MYRVYYVRKENMLCTNRDNTARTYDAQAAAATERGPGGIEAPRHRLKAVQDSAGPAPSVTHKTPERSNRVFNWLVVAGLVVLIALLAAVMLNAAINVEVLP